MKRSKIVRVMLAPFAFVLRLSGILIAVAAGLIFAGFLFIDELPLGEATASLAADPAEGYLDAHVHVAGIGSGESGAFVSKRLLDSYKFPFYLRAFGSSYEELAREGDAVLFKKISDHLKASRYVREAVILALDGVMNEQGELDREKTEFYVPNDFVSEQVKKYDNLHFGASVNPHRKGAIDELLRVKRAGAVLIKWIPAIMEIDPSDHRLVPFYLALVELDLPLLTHAGQERSFSIAQDELGDPQKLELPLRLGVKVIAAHVATTGKNDGEENMDRLLPLFKKYPNLYADISSLTQINKLGYLKRVLSHEDIQERLIYGSDWPLQFFPLVSPWYHLRHIRAADARFISKQQTAWDRDVLLKKAIGVPEAIFSRTGPFIKNRRTLEEIEATPIPPDGQSDAPAKAP